MGTNNTVESKIKRYSALAGGLTAVAGVANAQIVHTEINPDTFITGNGAVYNLDVDNNGVVDYTFYTITSSITYTFGNSSTFINFSGAYMNPAASAIGSNASFSSFDGCVGGVADVSLINPSSSSSYTFSIGNFLEADGFVGLKFQNSGNTHYGWVRIEVANGGDFLFVKEYAFESTPNTAINAGETANGPVGIADLENSVNINNFNNQLKITSSKILTNGIINVVSISGKKVVYKSFNINYERIDLNDLSTGIYIVNVYSDQGVINKKIYVI